MKKMIPVVVTTAHKGVFFGMAKTIGQQKSIRIESARMCIYWSNDIKGVMGLAATGPSSTCRVGPAIPAITLSDVTAIMEATSEAAVAWNKAPWSL